MTNSRSTASTSRVLALAIAACVLAVLGTVAHADGRKRVVVLDFEGPRSEKFHEDLVKLIKKTHTVVPTEKWNGAADQLGAGAVSDRNVKKVARKLKIDAIVEGKVEKRRDEFILRLKLRAGRSGELIGDSIDTKAEGPRIDGRAQRDLKDELIGAIDNVETNHLSGDDDEDDRPAPKKAGAKKPAADDDEDDRPAPKKAGAKKPAADDEGDKPRRVSFSRRNDDERGGDKVDKRTKKPAEDDDEDKLPPKKPAGKKVAAADDDDKPAPKKAGAKKPAADDDEDKLPPKKPAGKKVAAADDDDKPAPKKAGAKKPAADDDEDKLPPKKPAGKKVAAADDDDKLPPKKPAAKKPDAGDDKLPPKKPAAKPEDDKLPPKKPAAKPEEDKPAKKPAARSDDDKPARPKKVAARDDDDGSAEAEAEGKPLDATAALSPGERALDAVVGLSVTMRRMSFKVSPTLRATPAGYKGIPVAGAMLDATFYPLALGHTRTDQLRNLGVEVLYDRVLKLNSKDPMTGMTYSSLESRFWLAGVFRYALGRSATAPVVLGSLGYSRQSFNILGPVDIPDVKYQIIAPGAGLRFPVMSRLTLAADAKFLLVVSAGQIQDGNQYGAASVYGFEGSAGADYLIKPNLFARAAFRFETIGLTFKGTGSQSNARDGNPMTVDVFGARDTYFGGVITVGYIY